MNTFVSLGGIKITIDAPFPFSVEKAHEPFVGSEDSSIGLFNTNLIFSQIESLPERPKGYFGDECRFYHKSIPNDTWFSLWPDSEPFAFGDYTRAPEQISVNFLPNQIETVCKSRTLLRLLEPERLFNLNGGFMLHGSLIAASDGGIVFSGPSGIGKSTQALLWEKYAGAEVLNGDRCALMPGQNGWEGWGLPFAGTSGIYKNENTKIKAVVMLEQANVNCIRRAGITEAFSFLYPQINHQRWNKDLVGRTVDALIRIIQDIPIFKLSCRPDEGAVALLRREVFGED